MSGLVENPLFYQMIGQQIALNRENDGMANEVTSLRTRINRLNGEVGKANDYIDSL